MFSNTLRPQSFAVWQEDRDRSIIAHIPPLRSEGSRCRQDILGTIHRYGFSISLEITPGNMQLVDHVQVLHTEGLTVNAKEILIFNRSVKRQLSATPIISNCRFYAEGDEPSLQVLGQCPAIVQSWWRHLW